MSKWNASPWNTMKYHMDNGWEWWVSPWFSVLKITMFNHEMPWMVVSKSAHIWRRLMKLSWNFRESTNKTRDSTSVWRVCCTALPSHLVVIGHVILVFVWINPSCPTEMKGWNPLRWTQVDWPTKTDFNMHHGLFLANDIFTW
jgi:hypothetical protein